MFGLVMPERVAEEVVKRDVKMIFDPSTKELIEIIMPFMTKSEVMTLKVDKGWVTEASVEDVKLLPGVHRTMFRLQGGEWVTREIVKDVNAGRAEFIVNSGDVVWWGNQGLTVDDSPYWKRVNDTLLKRLPPPTSEMRAAGLQGRWFLGVGNHEVWADPKIEGVLSAVPYLRKLGVTPENLIYKFDFKGVRRDQPAQIYFILRQGHGGGRVQRPRPYHRDVRRRRREISFAGRRRRGTGSDFARSDQHQGSRGLSGGSLLEGRASEGRV